LTLADQVGACRAVLTPLLPRVEPHLFAAKRLHGDNKTVPVLAKGKTDAGRLWTYVRDNRPFGGRGTPAAMFYYARPWILGLWSRLDETREADRDLLRMTELLTMSSQRYSRVGLGLNSGGESYSRAPIRTSTFPSSIFTG
jgi:hypothetical protein